MSWLLDTDVLSERTRAKPNAPMHSRFVTFFLFAAVLVFGSTAFCAEQTNSTQLLTVHGRLMYYNGNPSCRIWIVGAKRLLGVQESGDEMADMPKAPGNMMSWDREIFADFIIRSHHRSRESCRSFELFRLPRLL
jgi:hypothetical protein